MAHVEAGIFQPPDHPTDGNNTAALSYRQPGQGLLRRARHAGYTFKGVQRQEQYVKGIALRQAQNMAGSDIGKTTHKGVLFA